MSSSLALAALYARQLYLEMPTRAHVRAEGEDGKRAWARVHQVRKLFFQFAAGADDFFEIGAHHAEASRQFVDERPGRRAFAFEAVPVFAEEARRLHQGRPIEVIAEAIGAEPGTAVFRVPVDPRLAQWSSSKTRTDHGFDLTEIVVPVVTLDAAAARLGARRTAVWMDVEGAQMDVLRGGAVTFSEHVDAVYLELYDRPVFADVPSSVEMLASLIDSGFVPVARDNQFPGGYNLVAVHRRIYGAHAETILSAIG